VLEETGGLQQLKDVLAEDYVMGQLVRNTGRKVHISRHLINNVNTRWKLARFWNRHTRWGQLRLSLGGPAYIWELLANPVFLAFLPLCSGQSFRAFLGVAFIASALKASGDYLLGKRVGADLKASYYFLVPFKDLLVGLMWFYPFFIKTVTWRGHTCRITSGSKLREINVPDDLNWARRLLFKLRASTV
jgi:ceramide glucosyltransferase